MTANFNLGKEERKAFVKALGEVTGEKPAYKGAPSFAFAVGGYTVDRYGAVDFGAADCDTVSALLSALSEKGFAFEGDIDGIMPGDSVREAPDADGADDAEQDTADSGTDDEADTMDACEGSGREAPDADSAEDAEQDTADSGVDSDAGVPAAESTADTGVLSIDMPVTGFTASAFDNLSRLVTSKAWILRKMAGCDDLRVERDTDRLRFPWFSADASSAETDAYSRLIAALCETAKSKQRVTATERRPKDGDNEKFKARCFLLSLGFIGEDTKQARKILLEGFSGNGSHSTGNGRKSAPKAIAPAVCVGGLSENGVDQAMPRICAECPHHCYYTDGVMLTGAGDAVDTSKRKPDRYTHYCLKTPSGFRKIKFANDWNGSETPPGWCPLRGSATAENSENDEGGVTVCGGREDVVRADTGGHRDCLACSHAHSEPAETEGDFDRLFCVERQEYVEEDGSCECFN